MFLTDRKSIAVQHSHMFEKYVKLSTGAKVTTNGKK